MKQMMLWGIILLVFTACTQDLSQIEGRWQVKNRFYSAVYDIFQEGDAAKARILYYNDGTTIIKAHDSLAPRFLLHNIQKQDELYVDALSGATHTSEPMVTISVKHLDTLEVTMRILNQPLTEIWTRIPKKQTYEK